MSKLKKIGKPENIILIKKYVSLSLVGYAYVFLVLYLLVDYFEMNKSLAFIMVYSSWYILLYVLQLKYLFNKQHDSAKFLRFYGTLLFFYICANLLYNLGIYLELNYLLSTLITVIVLMPFRLIASKLYVFKD